MMGKPHSHSDRSAAGRVDVPHDGAKGGWSTRVLGTTVARAKAVFFAARKPAEPAFSTVVSAATEAQKSQLTQMAAALSYRTIFGLLPVIIVALVGVKYFASEENVRSAVETTLHYSGLSAIAVPTDFEVPPWDPKAVGPPPPGAEMAAVDGPSPRPSDVAGSEGALGDVPSGEPVAISEKPPPAVDRWITDLIERVNSVSLKAIGFAGGAMLVYAALAMLVEIERAFNQIYGVPRGRSWIRRIMQYWTLLTLGPLALIMTFYVGQQFVDRAQRLAASNGVELDSSTITVTAIGYATTVLISTAFFLVAYICVPNTKVKIWPALVGAFAAALMWEAGKWGFTRYLAYSTGTAMLYGALALIPLFLLWVYFTWLIVLFGLQIAYELQHGRAKTRAQPIAELGPTLVDPAAALVVLAAIARGFDAGKTLDAPEVTASTKLPEGVVRLVLAKLAERALLHRIKNGSDEAEPKFALARPPAGILVSEILEMGYELAGPTGADGAVERLHRAQIESVAGQTLATLASGTEPAKPEVSDARAQRPENGSARAVEPSEPPVLARSLGAPATLSEQD